MNRSGGGHVGGVSGGLGVAGSRMREWSTQRKCVSKPAAIPPLVLVIVACLSYPTSGSPFGGWRLMFENTLNAAPVSHSSYVTS